MNIRTLLKKNSFCSTNANVSCFIKLMSYALKLKYRNTGNILEPKRNKSILIYYRALLMHCKKKDKDGFLFLFEPTTIITSSDLLHLHTYYFKTVNTVG